MNNSKFNNIKAKHPEWSDEQIWTAVSLDMETDNVIENRGSDIDPNDPNTIKQIVTGAKKWLEEVLPNIFEKVAKFFEKLIITIGTWVQKGLTYVVELIDKLI